MKKIFGNAEVIKWWDGNDMNTISEEKDEYSTPYLIKRISDGFEFQVGNKIMYPRIHEVDSYPILCFRIQDGEILINSHPSHGLRFIDGWVKI